MARMLILNAIGGMALALVLLLAAASRAFAADPTVQELIDVYKQREAKIQSIEVRWAFDHVERQLDGSYAKYARKWRVLKEGEKVRTEEAGGPMPGGKGSTVLFVNAFNGKVGKRFADSDGVPNAAGTILPTDGSEMLTVNNGDLDCFMLSFFPSVVLTSRDNARSELHSEASELDGQRIIVLRRKIATRAPAEERLFIDPTSLLIKRATLANDYSVLQWDIEYQDVDGQTLPACWKWTNTLRTGQLELSRTSRELQIKLNPTLSPTDFEFEFRPGTFISDKINDEAYVLEANGEKRVPPVIARAQASRKAAQDAAEAKRKSFLGKPLVVAGASPEGNAVSLKDYIGKVVLVHFWSTDDYPSIDQIPDIQSAYAKFHAQGLEVVGVTIDERVEILNKFVVENKMPWLQIIDQRDRRTQEHPSSRFAINGRQVLFLIDKQGTCRAIEDSKHIDAVIPKLLAE